MARNDANTASDRFRSRRDDRGIHQSQHFLYSPALSDVVISIFYVVVLDFLGIYAILESSTINNLFYYDDDGPQGILCGPFFPARTLNFSFFFPNDLNKSQAVFRELEYFSFILYDILFFP